ncbi:MAG: hypothetical protein AAGI52_15925 [Bacteroidota bacterium]
MRTVLLLSLLLGACTDASPNPAVVDAIVFEAPDGKLYVDGVALDQAFNRGSVEAEITEAAKLDLDEPELLMLAMYLNEYGDSGMMDDRAPWICAHDPERIAELNSLVADYTDYVYEC